MNSTPLPASLATYLRHAAATFPQALALSGDGIGDLDFATLLARAEAVAGDLPAGDAPVVACGDAVRLALLACACSLRQRPFYPVEREVRGTLPPPLSGAALLIATSGSEGAPRTVPLAEARLDAAAAASNRQLGLDRGDLWLACLPMFHIGGQSILWRCLRAGAAMRLSAAFSVERLAADFAERPVTHVSLVPAMLSRLLYAGIAPPASLRVALIGGAALSLPLYKQARAAGWPLCVSYGMTETAAMLAVHRPADGPWHPGLAGRPLPGNDVTIRADGRIAVRGAQVMAGYLGGGGIDAEGWLLTGDLGEIDADGRLTVLGRADDMLISGGRNVHPAEIEACLAGCPGIADVAVTGLPDPVWGDRIVALVVGSAEPAAILEHARQALPSAALPRTIRQLERLPRNAAGKLQRAELRRLAAEADS